MFHCTSVKLEMEMSDPALRPQFLRGVKTKDP